MGFEPTTLCVQSRCSSNWSYTPINWRLQGRYKITNRQSYHALNVPLVNLMRIEPICFPVCKTGDHPLAVPKPINNLENLIKRTLPVFILYSYNATHYSATVTISLSPRAVALKLLTAVPENRRTQALRGLCFPPTFTHHSEEFNIISSIITKPI